MDKVYLVVEDDDYFILHEKAYRSEERALEAILSFRRQDYDSYVRQIQSENESHEKALNKIIDSTGLTREQILDLNAIQKVIHYRYTEISSFEDWNKRRWSPYQVRKIEVVE